MKKTKAEIIADLTAFIGENQSDEAVALIENVSDSIDDNAINWEEKYKENDKAWRQKYIDRFNNEENKDNNENEVIDIDDDSNEKQLTFENLFEEG